jgi:hypothetical protein
LLGVPVDALEPVFAADAGPTEPRDPLFDAAPDPPDVPSDSDLAPELAED